MNLKKECWFCQKDAVCDKSSSEGNEMQKGEKCYSSSSCRSNRKILLLMKEWQMHILSNNCILSHPRRVKDAKK